MRSHDIDNMKSFVWFIQVISNMTLMTQKIAPLAAYLVHAILLNVSAKRQKWLICNGYTMIGFLPACYSEEQVKRDESEEDEEMSVY